MSEHQSEAEIRREKLESLRELGYPYPNDVSINITCQKVFEEAEKLDEPDESQDFRVAGRIMTKRLMGKAAFFHLQDRSGRIQVYIRKDQVGDEVFDQFKTFDLGDIVEVGGYGFKTKTGEPSLRARSARLLVKCLHPLPEKWHGLSDVAVSYTHLTLPTTHDV